MATRNHKNVNTIMKEGTLVDAALVAGVREALERHRRAGQSVVESRNGKIVWLTPDEIKKRLEKIDNKKNRP